MTGSTEPSRLRAKIPGGCLHETSSCGLPEALLTGAVGRQPSYMYIYTYICMCKHHTSTNQYILGMHVSIQEQIYTHVEIYRYVYICRVDVCFSLGIHICMYMYTALMHACVSKYVCPFL